jgi:hypothetical protein
MGAWSIAPYDNDVALDWLGDLLASPGPVDWHAEMEAVLAAFADFEQRRAGKRNKRVMTPEYVEYVISLVEPPCPPHIVEALQASIGQSFDDNGDDETFRLVAVAALLLALATDDLSAIHEDLRVPRLQEARAGLPLAERCARALREVPRNGKLVREFGPRWKTGVLGLADRLDRLTSLSEGA